MEQSMSLGKAALDISVLGPTDVQQVRVLLVASFGTPALDAVVNPEWHWYIMRNHSGTIVACAAVDLENILWNVCVDPRLQRVGIGTRMLRRVCKDYPDLRVYITKGNEAVMPFYARRGFRVVQGVTTDYHTMVRKQESSKVKGSGEVDVVRTPEDIKKPQQLANTGKGRSRVSTRKQHDENRQERRPNDEAHV